MSTQYDAILQVGERLRSYRLGKGLTPEQVAKETGISRAAIYRYESGQPIRVDALGKIADLLDVSLTSLFGVGSEYITSALTFFERMKQIEDTAEQISVLFGPVSYLLTTQQFDAILGQVLNESVPEGATDRENLETEVRKIVETLRERKATFQKRRPNIVSLVSSAELEQFALSGFVGKQGITGPELDERKAIARGEIENIIRLLEEQPIGVQIGVVEDSTPGSSFQIFRNGNKAQVAVSPFRLGSFPNIRIGVATITSAQESIQLHQQVTEQLWKNSLKGVEAVNRLKKILQ
ncbi:helix-turn-helix domain-containing protein [Thalassovita aquimarina]|uniref:Helix-turn-helix transcriptional regulator n=1 Tax=Thalassovita aquimarina TaxID=2785917 RepID=A0ABS5HRT0_9RHOB|nr:helix-turn-helix transcriptional regulator [Thalassovita aquimarina]MBR9651536.1 helix-turn-helix transcriptional regulator [Thalassovita aquimarina]